jgi:hypothetical protein
MPSAVAGGLITLLALARRWLGAALLVAAGTEGEGCGREGDNRCDLRDGGHCVISPPF